MVKSSTSSAPVNMDGRFKATGNIVRVRITIRGTRPLLQHAFGPDSIPLEAQERTGKAGNDPSEWRKSSLVTPKGQLYLPGTYVFACIRDAAKHTKKGKGSIQPLVAATLQVEDTLILLDRHMPEGEPKYVVAHATTDPVYIDVCGVRNPSTKARNVRYRLCCGAGWSCFFTILWDKTLVAREVMREIVHNGSILCGIGDGRSVGMGRFEVEEWMEV